MKKYISFLLSLVLALSLCACGAEKDPNIGLYTLSQIHSGENDFQSEEVFSQVPTLELKKKGAAVLNIEEKYYSGLWQVNNEKITVAFRDGQNSLTLKGSIKEGVCTLSKDKSSQVYTFVRDNAGGGDIQAEPLTETQQYWNRDYYGWWSISSAQGEWAELEGQKYDCFAKIYIDAQGRGTLTFWDEEQSEAEPIAVADVALRLSQKSPVGVLKVTGGKFFRQELQMNQWIFDPYNGEYEDTLMIEDIPYVSDEGSFNYTLVLRPWGQLWDDVKADNEEYQGIINSLAYQYNPYYLEKPLALPYFYESWYIPRLAASAPMPSVPDCSAVLTPDDTVP